MATPLGLPMRRFVITGTVSLAVIGLALAVVQAEPRTTPNASLRAATLLAPKTAQLPGWRVVDLTARTGYPGDLLADVAAPDAQDAWAVGSTTADGQALRPLIRRWDGNSWRTVAAPALPKGTWSASLSLVRAASATDVWAFGIREYGSGGHQAAFGVHWNGDSWRQTDFGPDTVVYDAAAGGPKGTWITGAVAAGTGSLPWARRFDGRVWRPVTLPGYVWSLSMRTPGDLWGVGRTLTKPERPFTVHWNGHGWLPVSTPPKLRDGREFGFTGVLATGPKEVWATAVPLHGKLINPASVLLRWDGTVWSHVKIKSIGESLYGLAPDGAGGVWILAQPAAVPFATTWLLHYANGRLTRQQAPARPGARGNLMALTLIPGTRSLWGAGGLHGPGDTVAAVYKYGP